MAKGKNNQQKIFLGSATVMRCECGFQTTSETEKLSLLKFKLHKKKCDIPVREGATTVYINDIDLDTGVHVSNAHIDAYFKSDKIDKNEKIFKA